MDTIAALNFGLVISTTLGAFGLKEKRDKMRCTVLAGVLAGTILVLVYAALAYMGMCSSGVYEIQENGAWTLRCIVYQVFGKTGAVLLTSETDEFSAMDVVREFGIELMDDYFERSRRDERERVEP